MRDYKLVSDASGRQVKNTCLRSPTITFAELRDGVRAIANAWRYEKALR